MSSLDEAISKIRSFAQAIEREAPVIVLSNQLGLKSIIQNRVQQTGQDAVGGQLGEYSPFTKSIRRKKGRQTLYVDLTDTGRMWRNIKQKKQTTTSGKTTVIIAPTTARSNELAEKNEQRYGNFLEPSQLEINNTTEDIEADFNDLLIGLFNEI